MVRIKTFNSNARNSDKSIMQRKLYVVGRTINFDYLFFFVQDIVCRAILLCEVFLERRRGGGVPFLHQQIILP